MDWSSLASEWVEPPFFYDYFIVTECTFTLQSILSLGHSASSRPAILWICSTLIIFSQMHFLLLPENKLLFHEIKCDGLTSFTDFLQFMWCSKEHLAKKCEVRGVVWNHDLLVLVMVWEYVQVFWHSMHEYLVCKPVYKKNCHQFLFQNLEKM